MVWGMRQENACRSMKNRVIVYLYTYPLYNTRGLWTAMPALIKVKETGLINQHFYMEFFSKMVQFYGKKQNVCAQFLILAQKALFLPPL